MMGRLTCLASAGLVFAFVVGSWLFSRDAAFAAPIVPAANAATGLITHVQELDGKLLRLIVIDPAQRVMGVYEITRDTGEIQPKSIRNFHADLQMLEFNGGLPSPADIQKTLERK
jgi:hypothetical protein